MRGIGKSFGPVRVLDDVDFDVGAGEVHVLAGENGAGKSTLINILSGVHVDYEGELRVRGRELRLSGPLQASREGIATIHQELSLVSSMTVSDNLFLGRERVTRWGSVDFPAQEAASRRIIDEAGLEVTPLQPVGSLPVATRQMLEIARAMAQEAVVLVLDEPTSALGSPEVERLFHRIRELRDAGAGVVYISHKMEEIYRIADRITVLRDGKRVATRPAAELPADELVELMVGRTVRSEGPRRETASAEAVLSVRDLVVFQPAPPERRVVDGVSFDLSRGEVVGLAGLQGSGTSEVLHALFGNRRPGHSEGSFLLAGEPYDPKSPRDALDRGVALVSNDRQALGLAPDQSVAHSVALAALPGHAGALGWVDRARERQAVEGAVSDFGIKGPSLKAPVRTLSGGNQQKVFLARFLLTHPTVLLLDEPTRGIDVGAKADIYAQLGSWVDQGVSVLLTTSELDELLLLADRILAMHGGRVVAELSGTDTTKAQVLAAAMGRGSTQ